MTMPYIQSMVLGPVASSSSGSLLEMLNLRPHSKPTESESAFEPDPQGTCLNISFEKHCCLLCISQGPSMKQMSTTGETKGEV